MTDSKKKTVSPRAGLSRKKVLRAALRIADRDGIEAMSMRKLAQSLNVEAMSLYNHVSGKDDVLDGLVEIVVAKIELPDSSKDWKSAMRKRAFSAHEVLLSHPWAALLFVSRINIGPSMLRYVDATIGCLCTAGFSYEIADRAWNAIDGHIYGFTLQALNFPFEPTEFTNVAEEYLPRISEEKYPYLNELSKQVIAGTHDGVQEFGFGLDLILDSLDRLYDGTEQS